MSLCRLVATAGVAALLAAGAAAADGPAVVLTPRSEPSARALALARRYVEATGQANAVRTATVLASASMIGRLSDGDRPILSGEEIVALETAFNDASGASVDREIEARARLYAREFTEAELEALLAPFEGPDGPALSAKMLKLSSGDAAVARLHQARLQSEALAAFCRERPDQRLCRPEPARDAAAKPRPTVKQAWESARW